MLMSCAKFGIFGLHLVSLPLPARRPPLPPLRLSGLVQFLKLLRFRCSPRTLRDANFRRQFASFEGRHGVPAIDPDNGVVLVYFDTTVVLVSLI